jgi:hypothetical protein
MLRGADCMVPNTANKESAFHYCAQSGNSEVNRLNIFKDFKANVLQDFHFTSLMLTSIWVLRQNVASLNVYVTKRNCY